jgi:uncharacterized protein YyaL (SSP411 family)
MLNNVKDDTKKSGLYFSNWARLLLKFVYPPYEVSITGQNIEIIRKEFEQNFLVNIVIAGTNKSSKLPMIQDHNISDKTSIFVCQNKVCKMPVHAVEEALKLMIVD